jgi:UDP-glucuronate decarboxylase
MAADDGRVVSNFIVQALKGEDITVYGTGQQTRSFCYVDDLITGMICLMESADHITGPFNMGNPVEFTMLDLAEKVIKFTGSKSMLIYKDLPQDDPQQRKPDISKAKKRLGWEPRFDLDEGLIRTIRYFEDALGINHE